MKVWTLISVILFQFLTCTMAVWNVNSPLILVQPSGFQKMFPSTVRESTTHHCIVYTGWGDNTTVTYPFCPKINDEDPNCNYADAFTKSHYREGPPENCPSPVQFYLMKLTIGDTQQHRSCTHNGKTGYRYRSVYKLCKENDPNYKRGIVIYDVCYQETFKQIILGSFTIETPKLLKNTHLSVEQEFNFSFVTMASYEEMDYYAYLYEENPGYVQRAVLPHELLAFAHQRKPLYHCINLAPMKTEFIYVWEMVMEHLKTRISQKTRPINITAGLIYEEVQENIRYVGQIEQVGEFEIPIIWWILIYNKDNSKGVAILMHNELYYTYRGEPNLQYYNPNLCSRGVCYEANLGNALPDVDTYPGTFIYCCYPGVINEKFGLSGSDNILEFPDESEPEEWSVYFNV